MKTKTIHSTPSNLWLKYSYKHVNYEKMILMNGFMKQVVKLKTPVKKQTIKKHLINSKTAIKHIIFTKNDLFFIIQNYSLQNPFIFQSPF